MKGVTFGNYHSYDDFNLILSQKRIGTPSPKTNVIDIAGGDGVLDLTEYFGDVKYNNRSISFDFSTTVPQAQFMDLFSQVQNALHGQKLRITLDDDPEFYYVGRISVSEWKADKGIGQLTIDCDCEPWKYKQNETVVSVNIDGTTDNFYSPKLIKDINPLFHIGQDEYISINFENDSVGVNFYNIFSRTNSIILEGGMNYSIVVEVQNSSVEGNVDFRITSVENSSIYDYFANAITKRIVNQKNAFWIVYPAKTRDSLENAYFIMRSYIQAQPQSKVNLKFRISVIKGIASSEGFVYTSDDGMMKGIRLNNFYKKVVPTIKASAPCTVLFEGKTFAINAGTYTIPEIALKQGINDIAVKGIATVTFTYREGGL